MDELKQKMSHNDANQLQQNSFKSIISTHNPALLTFSRQFQDKKKERLQRFSAAAVLAITLFLQKVRVNAGFTTR